MATAQQLLDEVRLRGMLPSASVIGVSDADIIDQANNTMASEMVPLLLSLSEEFFVVQVDIPLVANQVQYRVPNNNIGGRVRNLALILGNSQTQLARIEPERLGVYTINAIGSPRSFFMDGGNVNLIPGPGSAGGLLRMRYYARPGQLTIDATKYASLATVAYGSQLTSLTATTTTPGTLAPSAGTYDIVTSTSPFNTAVQAATVTTGPLTITATNNFPQTIQNGDFICEKDYSPVIQLPVEAQSLFVQRTLCAVLEQLGDNAKLEPALARAEKLKAMAMIALQPRTDGNPQKMRGLLSGGNGYGFGLNIR